MTVLSYPEFFPRFGLRQTLTIEVQKISELYKDVNECNKYGLFYCLKYAKRFTHKSFTSSKHFKIKETHPPLHHSHCRYLLILSYSFSFPSSSLSPSVRALPPRATTALPRLKLLPANVTLVAQRSRMRFLMNQQKLFGGKPLPTDFALDRQPFLVTDPMSLQTGWMNETLPANFAREPLVCHVFEHVRREGRLGNERGAANVTPTPDERLVMKFLMFLQTCHTFKFQAAEVADGKFVEMRNRHVFLEPGRVWECGPGASRAGEGLIRILVEELVGDRLFGGGEGQRAESAGVEGVQVGGVALQGRVRTKLFQAEGTR